MSDMEFIINDVRFCITEAYSHIKDGKPVWDKWMWMNDEGRESALFPTALQAQQDAVLYMIKRNEDEERREEEEADERKYGSYDQQKWNTYIEITR